MISKPFPPTTHTVTLSQLAKLNQRIANPAEARITAVELGLEGAPLLPAPESGAGLAGFAVLARLCCEGPPEFPYIHAHFSTSRGPSAAAPLIVDLHTAVLQALGHRFGLRQSWGD